MIFHSSKGAVSAFLRDFYELFGGTAKFWGVENVNIAFKGDQLVPIFSFDPQSSISTASDLSKDF